MTTDKTFKAIADETRRKILDALKTKTMTAGELATYCNTTKPNLSQHLNVLKENNLIEEKKEGRFVFYSLHSSFLKVHEEVMPMISIKQSILTRIKESIHEKKCESVLGTDSHDEGTIYINKHGKILVTLHYSFRLNSFVISFEKPCVLPQFFINYNDNEKMEEFLKSLQGEIAITSNTHKEREDILYTFFCIALNKVEEEKLCCFTNNEHTKEVLTILISSLLNEKSANKISALLNNKEQVDPLFQNEKERQTFIHDLVQTFLGFGPLEPILEREEVEQVTLHADGRLFVHTENGVYKEQHSPFQIPHEAATYIQNIILIDKHTSTPCQKADIHHIKLDNRTSVLTIKKKKVKKQTPIFSEIPNAVKEFLSYTVRSRANILISGTKGSGKTTALQTLADYIPEEDSVVTYEDKEELQLGNKNAFPFFVHATKPFYEHLKPVLHFQPTYLLVDTTRDTYNPAFRFMQESFKSHMTTILSSLPENALSWIEKNIDSSLKCISAYTSFDLVIHMGENQQIDSIYQIQKDERTGQHTLIKLCERIKETEELILNYVPLSTGLQHKLSRYANKPIHFPKDIVKKNSSIPSRLPESELLKHLIHTLDVLNQSMLAGSTWDKAFAVPPRFSIEPFTSTLEKMKTQAEAGAKLEEVLKQLTKDFPSPHTEFAVNTLTFFRERLPNSSGQFFLQNIREALQDRLKALTLSKEKQDTLFFLDYVYVFSLQGTSLIPSFTKAAEYMKEFESETFKGSLLYDNDSKSFLQYISEHTKNQDLLFLVFHLMSALQVDKHLVNEFSIVKKYRNTLLSSL